MHPNLMLLMQLGKRIPDDLSSAEDLIADDFIWHYFNPRYPTLAGDYSGRDGLQTFFQRLGELTDGTFRVEQGDAIPVGDELVVTCAKPSMTIEGNSFETDAVVVWRMVDNRIVEGWDIPAIHAIRPQVQEV